MNAFRYSYHSFAIVTHGLELLPDSGRYLKREVAQLAPVNFDLNIHDEAVARLRLHLLLPLVPP